jgi:hypothetical protein
VRDMGMGLDHVEDGEGVPRGIGGRQPEAREDGLGQQFAGSQRSRVAAAGLVGDDPEKVAVLGGPPGTPQDAEEHLAPARIAGTPGEQVPAVIGGQPVGRMLGGQLLQEDPVKEPQVLVPVPDKDAKLPLGDLGERPGHAGRGLSIHGQVPRVLQCGAQVCAHGTVRDGRELAAFLPLKSQVSQDHADIVCREAAVFGGYPRRRGPGGGVVLQQLGDDRLVNLEPPFRQRDS